MHFNPNTTIDHNGIRRARKATQKARSKGRPKEPGFSLAAAAAANEKHRQWKAAFDEQVRQCVEQAAKPEGLNYTLSPDPLSQEADHDWDWAVRMRDRSLSLARAVVNACRNDARFFDWNKDWHESGKLTIKLSAPRRKAA